MLVHKINFMTLFSYVKQPYVICYIHSPPLFQMIVVRFLTNLFYNSWLPLVVNGPLLARNHVTMLFANELAICDASFIYMNHGFSLVPFFFFFFK